MDQLQRLQNAEQLRRRMNAPDYTIDAANTNGTLPVKVNVERSIPGMIRNMRETLEKKGYAVEDKGSPIHVLLSCLGSLVYLEAKGLGAPARNGTDCGTAPAERIDLASFSSATISAMADRALSLASPGKAATGGGVKVEVRESAQERLANLQAEWNSLEDPIDKARWLEKHGETCRELERQIVYQRRQDKRNR